MARNNKIPIKPTKTRSRYKWWRRFAPHKYLSYKKGLLARIRNRDFEYPELFKHAEWELYWMKEEQKQFIDSYKGNEYWTDNLYLDIERKARKRHNKIMEDAFEMELRHLDSLAENLSKEFEVTKAYVTGIMNTFGGTTEQLYFHIGKKKGYNMDTFLKLKGV